MGRGARRPAGPSRRHRRRGVGPLRIDFDGGDEDLEPISWDEFFEAFDENDLAVVYQDETSGGEESRFAKLVSRED